MVEILIADDHEVVRRGVRDVLQAHAGWSVCGETHSGREAVGMATLLGWTGISSVSSRCTVVGTKCVSNARHFAGKESSTPPWGG